MVGNKVIKVGETEYRITQLGALEGRKLWLRLVKVLGPVVSKLAGAKALDGDTIAAAVKLLTEELDEETFEMLCKAFAGRCQLRNGDKWPDLSDALFDQHFAGDYVSMTKWVGENIMFNFANFSGDASLGKLLAMVTAKAATKAAAAGASQSPSPQA